MVARNDGVLLMKPLLTVSDEAKAWLGNKISGDDVLGVKVIVNQKGCAGGEYEFSLVRGVDDISDCDKVTDNDVTIYFPRTDLLKLIGSQLVLNKDQFNTRLDFKNPNEDSRCGCGESVSFKVER
jgi:iron-sulfur cluster assembly protein